jgi:hypothetical protein
MSPIESEFAESLELRNLKASRVERNRAHAPNKFNYFDHPQPA